MILRVGSAVFVPGNDAVQRVTRLAEHEGIAFVWYQAMTGDKTEHGPIAESELRSGVGPRLRFSSGRAGNH
jgi:hypothetical protein